MKKGKFIVKASGKQERFSPRKLLRSLARSGAPKPIARSISNQISARIQAGASTRDIYEQAQERLQAESPPHAYRYALKRSIFDLGPTGFPFEQLIGRLCEKLGYDTQTNLMLAGRCVNHEVDVIADTPDLRSWVECKFHNEQGSIVDLKTALYVFGRFIDLKEQDPDPRKKQMWLVTNTRFSTEAIRFAECRGIKIIGWDYPEQGGLNVLLERHQLYPITCITTLNRKKKMDLIQRGIVTCDDFQKFSKLKISDVGIPEKKRQRISDDLGKM